MDQIKIGKFIQERRKEKKITQSKLAERLNVTDRAISKWENGNCLPDVSNIHELCKILDITINDLFSGEIVDMKDNEKLLEKNLLDAVRQKEESDKKLLAMEIICGVLCLIPLLFSIILVKVIIMEEWKASLIVLASLLPLLVVTPFMLKIEQIAGYYECEKCSYRYIPNYTSVFMAAHVGRTRRMKCPKCGDKSWQKKVISKEK
ncbi:MAG: helix-turn-helix transcriptional regulator [Bacilli bacterium]|nr:helix-turn-helix transcriptional regulator [Bacilli bacterium]